MLKREGKKDEPYLSIDDVEDIALQVRWTAKVEEPCGLISRRRENEILVDQVLITARLVNLRQLGLECLVELEEILIGLDEWPGEHFFLSEVELTDTRIVH